MIGQGGGASWWRVCRHQGYPVYFLSMQCTNRSYLAMVAWCDHQEGVVGRRHLLVHWVQRKIVKHFYFIFLE